MAPPLGGLDFGADGLHAVPQRLGGGFRLRGALDGGDALLTLDIGIAGRDEERPHQSDNSPQHDLVHVGLPTLPPSRGRRRSFFCSRMKRSTANEIEASNTTQPQEPTTVCGVVSEWNRS